MLKLDRPAHTPRNIQKIPVRVVKLFDETASDLLVFRESCTMIRLGLRLPFGACGHINRTLLGKDAFVADSSKLV